MRQKERIMKVEEAIDRLKGLYGNNYEEQEEALNMAIAALEKGPEYLDHINHQREYITKLETYIAKNIPEWILIKDRLPDERQKVLLQYYQFGNDNIIQYEVTYRYNNVNWYKLNNIVPIEWMIFPEPYIEVGSRQQDKGE